MAAEVRTDEKDSGEQSSLLSKIWGEIDGYDQAARSFNSEGTEIYRQYVNQTEATSINGWMSRFPIVWSITQLVQPIVFSSMPQPYVERRFKDKDPQGRRASLILERCLKAVMGLQDTVGVIKQARDDYLLPGRGQLWMRYCPVYHDVLDTDESGNAKKAEDGTTDLYRQEVKYENVEIEYVPWKDFGYSAAKVWGGVKSVWRHLYLTKADAEKMLGDAEAGKLKYSYTGVTEIERTKEPDSSLHKRARVTEFWDYDSLKVYWISDSNRKTIIKEKGDFLKLGGFFPCPKPLFATKKTDTLIPVSDFTILKYLIQELDVVTLRESALMDAMKASGVSSGQVANALKAVFESDDGIIQPIKEWIALKQQGGTGGAIEWLPLDMFAKVLEGLRVRKAELKADIYELDGIGDVMRGATNPYESGKAIEQKSQYAAQRINEKQRYLQEFIRDTVNIVAEIIAEHFEDGTIYQMSGVEMLGPEFIENFPADVALLRDDVTRNFRIDVTLDSLVQADEEKEKAAVNEFINAMAQIMGQSQAILQVMPEMKPLMLEALKFAVTRYKAGRTLEGMLETTIDDAMAAQEAAKLQPPEPDPMLMIEQMKVETEQFKVQAKSELDAQKAQSKMELDGAKLQHQIQLDTAKLDVERAKLDKDFKDFELKQFQAQAKAQLDAANVEAKDKERELKEKIAVADMQLQVAELKAQQAETKASQEIELLKTKSGQEVEVFKTQAQIAKDHADSRKNQLDQAIETSRISSELAVKKKEKEVVGKEEKDKGQAVTQAVKAVGEMLVKAVQAIPAPIVEIPPQPKAKKKVGKITKDKDGSATVVITEE